MTDITLNETKATKFFLQMGNKEMGYLRDYWLCETDAPQSFLSGYCIVVLAMDYSNQKLILVPDHRVNNQIELFKDSKYYLKTSNILNITTIATLLFARLQITEELLPTGLSVSDEIIKS